MTPLFVCVAGMPCPGPTAGVAVSKSNVALTPVGSKICYKAAIANEIKTVIGGRADKRPKLAPVHELKTYNRSCGHEDD